MMKQKLLRTAALLAGLLCVAAPLTPAQAGTVQVVNGNGAWQSTACERPSLPPLASTGSETAAPDIGRNTNNYNIFVENTQKYLNCLAQEAKADSETSSNAIMASLNKEMTEAQAAVKQAHDSLFAR